MRRRSLVIAMVAMLVTTCGGQDRSESPPARSTAPVSPSGTATGATSGPGPVAVDSIEELRGAVFQVDQTGTFQYPDGGTRAAGGGSGFIIDPSGLAMTNSHVVAAQRSLTLWLGDERVEHEAEVVGVSECSDLAVVRIDGGPFPYLDWYDGEIQPGLDIYGAGFPLGDPEFTLNGGIVSRARGVIAETWASVQQKIEHDATINGGNSGGPVVTEQGEVVAVNYAVNKETRQAFAISRDEAIEILPELQAGRDVAAIGINPEALSVDVDDEPRPGVVVGAVRPGTTAERIGILPGDVILEIDGTPLEAENTMQQYCKVLRSHESDDVVDIVVWRSDVQKTMQAQINGDPIDPGFSFLAALPDMLPIGSGDATFSETGAGLPELRFETPSDWLDELVQPWTIGGQKVGPGVIASTSVAGFKGGWTTPGAYVAASDELNERTDESLLDDVRPRFEPDCTYGGRQEFARGFLVGTFDLWKECGGTESLFLVLFATPEVPVFTVYVQFQAATSEDLVALDRLFDTLMVSP